MVANVWLDHIHSEDLDCCLCTFKQVLLSFLRTVVGRLVTHSRLTVINFQVSEDVKLIRIQIVIESLLVCHSFLGACSTWPFLLV